MENNKLARNLGAETLKALEDNGKHHDEVLMVQCGAVCCDFHGFYIQACQINYVASERPPTISPDLMIIGKDWRLFRYVYNGEHFWENPERDGTERWKCVEWTDHPPTYSSHIPILNTEGKYRRG